MTSISDILHSKIDLPQTDIESLLQYSLNVNRSYLYTWPERELAPSELASINSAMAMRLSGTPVAYITGQREFYSRMFTVTEATLIPRHETERLIDVVLELNVNNHFQKILDMGTGSGIIPITLAKELNLKKITASDVSSDALLVSEKNAKKHNVSMQTIESHWFDSITDIHFDLITSNPPYIESEDEHLAKGDLRFEPSLALVSGKDGLRDIREIINNSKKHLKKSGYLVIEHGYNQAIQVQAIFKEASYTNIKTTKDFNNNDRVTYAQIA